MIAAGLGLVAMLPAMAKGSKGHGGSSAGAAGATISLNQSDPHFDGTVTFTVTGADGVSAPRITVSCYQSDALVYAGGGSASDAFTLGGGMSAWVMNGGGPAHCTAELGYFTWKGQNETGYVALASTSFDAAG